MYGTSTAKAMGWYSYCTDTWCAPSRGWRFAVHPDELAPLAWEAPHAHVRGGYNVNKTLALVLAVATALALVSTATTVVADDGGIPDCPPPEEQEVGPVYVGHGIDENYYVNAVDLEPAKIGSWIEENTWYGLQTEPGQCNYFGEVKSYSADIPVDTLGTTVSP